MNGMFCEPAMKPCPNSCGERTSTSSRSLRVRHQLPGLGHDDGSRVVDLLQAAGFAAAAGAAVSGGPGPAGQEDGGQDGRSGGT